MIDGIAYLELDPALWHYFPQVARAAVNGDIPGHCTLFYFNSLSTAESESAEQICRDLVIEPVVCEFGELKCFPVGKEYVPWYIHLNGTDQVTSLRNLLLETLKSNGFNLSQEHSFVPHITIGYTLPGESKPAYVIPTGTCTFAKLKTAFKRSK